MKYYEFDLNTVLKIKLLGKEHLTDTQLHCTRTVPEYIMYIIDKGELCLEFNGSPIALHEGDIIIFSEGDFHRPLKASECSYYFIHFDHPNSLKKYMSEEEYVKSFISKRINCLKSNIYGADIYNYFKIRLPEQCHITNKGLLAHIKALLDKNKIAPETNSPEFRFNVSSSVADIFMKIENHYIETIEKSISKKVSLAYSNVKKIASFVDINYKASFSGDDIEKEFFINFDYANRIFKKHTGMSIMKYRNALRINDAKKALIITSRSIGEISHSVGFDDESYFSRIFKKSEGISPSTYRTGNLTDSLSESDGLAYDITKIKD